MTKPIFVIFLLLGGVFAKASSLKDSIPPYKKLSPQEFIDRFTVDDSTKTLVDYYFQKRRNLNVRWILTGTGVVAGTVETIILGRKIGDRQGEPRVLAGLALGFAATIYFLILAPFFIGGLTGRFTKFTRRNLYRQLQEYKDGEPLPKKITRDKLFVRLYEANKRS